MTIGINSLQYSVVVKIEGIRIKGTSTNTTTETGFYFGTKKGLPTSNTEESITRTVDYINALDTVPSTISSEVDLFTSQYNLSAPTVSLVADDILTPFFFNMNKRGSTGKWANDVNSSNEANLTITYAGPLEVGDIIYSRDECMRVAVVNNYTDGVYNIHVKRRQGWLGAYQTHPQSGTVYINFVPYFNLRRIQILIYDNELYNSGDGTNTPIFTYTGLIEQVESNEDSTLINVGSRDLLSFLVDITLPESRDVFTPVWGEQEYIVGEIKPTNNNNFNDTEFIIPLNGFRQWQIKDSYYLTTGSLNSNNEPYGSQWFWHNNLLGLGKHPIFTSIINVQDLDDIKQIKEVLAFGFDDFEYAGYNPFAAYQIDGYNGLGSSFCRNPIAIALTFMLSTGDGTNTPSWTELTINPDILSARWGAGIPISYIDVTAWENAIIETKDIKIDNFLVGDEENFKLKDLVVKLLRFSNYFIYINSQGKISISKFKSFDIYDLEQSSSNTTSLNLDASFQNLVYLEPSTCKIIRDSKPQKVSAIIGGAPGDPTAVISAASITGDKREKTINAQQYTLDYRFYDISKSLRSGRYYSDIERQLRTYNKLLYEPNPFIECTVPVKYEDDTGIPGITTERGKVPELGAWVVLRGINEIIGPDGTRIKINEQDNWITFTGRLVAYSLDIKSMVYSIRVYLQNWANPYVGKLVAPSAKVSSYSGGTITLEVPGIYSSVDGTHGFKAGDTIQLVDEYGRPSYLMSTGVDTIISVNGNDIELNDGLVETSIPAGIKLYLKISDYANYSNTTGETYLQYLPTNQRRIWSFLSDDSGYYSDGALGEPWLF